MNQISFGVQLKVHTCLTTFFIGYWLLRMIFIDETIHLGHLGGALGGYAVSTLLVNPKSESDNMCCEAKIHKIMGLGLLVLVSALGLYGFFKN